MNRLSLLAISVLLAFTPAGSHSTTANPGQTVPAPVSGPFWVYSGSAGAGDFQTEYYWFTWPDDTYWDHKTLNDEIYEMWLYYTALVDTRPAGGTLIDRGFISVSYPHIAGPAASLYVHY